MNHQPHTADQLKQDLRALGIQTGDVVMMHSSFRSLGKVDGGAQTVFQALFDVLGRDGTLILPAFSYDSVTIDNPFFDIQKTPSCVGYLPEYFRTQVSGVIRSLHATHSCCLKGKLAEELARHHERDLTPVGKHSPISKLPLVNGKILMLGNHPNSNTSLHGVEELTDPIYLFNREETVHYELKNGDQIIRQAALRHCFEKDGYFYEQHYARVIDLMDPDEYAHGHVLDADCYLLSAAAVWKRAKEKLTENPLFFVNRIPR